MSGQDGGWPASKARAKLDREQIDAVLEAGTLPAEAHRIADMIRESYELTLDEPTECSADGNAPSQGLFGPG